MSASHKLSIILGYSGYALLAWFDWRLALGLFLIHCAKNLGGHNW